MQSESAITELKSRAAAIGLTLGALARVAKVAPSTAYRGAGGKSDWRWSTIQKLKEALTAKEAERLAELQGRANNGAGA